MNCQRIKAPTLFGNGVGEGRRIVVRQHQSQCISDWSRAKGEGATERRWCVAEDRCQRHIAGVCNAVCNGNRRNILRRVANGVDRNGVGPWRTTQHITTSSIRLSTGRANGNIRVGYRAAVCCIRNQASQCASGQHEVLRGGYIIAYIDRCAGVSIKRRIRRTQRMSANRGGWKRIKSSIVGCSCRATIQCNRCSRNWLRRWE